LEVRRLLHIGLPVYCAGQRGEDVALSFDDGPGPYTATALRILRGAHARATFFVVGRNLARFPLLHDEARLGSIGDHTWTHPFLSGLPGPVVRAELAGTKAAIEHSLGTSVTLFRPPYGVHDAGVDRVARQLGLIEVLWSVDSGDSEGARWNMIGATVERYLHPGAIILMHENHGQTIRALKFLILPSLRRHDLVPVDVNALLALDPPSLVQLRLGQSGCRGGGFVASRAPLHG
jgi:peptidoglycan/xylan/chitin deacetylase (PgdA/CDA1 family)